MPSESQLAHRVFRNPAFPYISNTSPLETSAYYASGSTDILTSINNYAQRRPGFADNVETTPTTFTSLQRLFTWDRFDGSFYIMGCDVPASGIVQVYKLQVGVDASFVSIYTEATASFTPYDFVVSNNTVYFSNGFFVKKWDPINGASNWGIAPYVASSSSNATAGTGANVAGPYSLAWSNPTDAQGAGTPPYATTASVDRGKQTDYLSLTNYSFSIPAANTIGGIQVDVTASYTASVGSASAGVLVCILLQNGSPVGISISNGITGSATAITFGGPSTLWNASWSGTLISASTFGVYVYGQVKGPGANKGTFLVRSAKITIYSSGAPTVTFTGTGLTASVGYQYVLCYGNSNTGHVSSPSVPSNVVKPANQSMSIPVVASTDPQVNQIRIFRTTDSATGFGGQSYFEIQNSPVANSSTSITDSSTDLALNIYSVAPTPTFNDPPTPMQAMQYFAGRIWGFFGSSIGFSGLEEINIGVPEESFPSGVAGNFFKTDEPVQGLGIAGSGMNQGIGVLDAGRIYGITGTTLDTFRIQVVTNRRGARNLTTVTSMGGMCAWLDTANQIWATDGSQMKELSIPIRPDISSVNQSLCCQTFHTSGNFHWLVFSTREKLFVYDMDTEQWMPPWTFPCKYLFSGETSPGNYVLMASTGTKAIQLNATKFNDNGVTYQPNIVTNLMSVVPDFGSRFSYIGQGMYDEPSRTGVPYYFQIDTNNTTLSDVQFMVDDDPTTATYQSIYANKQGADATWNRSASAVNIVQQIFPMNQPSCRWISFKMILQNADQLDKIYSYFLAYKALGGK